MLAEPVPEELDLHASVLVRVDLLSGRPHHHRRLRAVHAGPSAASRRPVGSGRRDAHEGVVVLRARRFPRAVVARLGSMRYVQEEVLLVRVGAVVLLERELVSAHERAAVACAADHLPPPRALFEQELRVARTLVQLQVRTGIVVDLLPLVGLRRRLEVQGRPREVVVTKRDLAEVHGGLQRDRGHHVLVLPGTLLDRHTRGVLPRTGLAGAIQVRQNERVRVLRVLEEVEDALFLEQAGHEVEVRLPVLHAVLTRGVGLRAS